MEHRKSRALTAGRAATDPAGMCNHYRNLEKEMREWAAIEQAAFADALQEVAEDVWPKRPGYVLRMDAGARVIEPMRWGFELTLPGAREGTTRKSQVTNVRNLTSQMWRNRLATPAKRCLVPFTSFAEPKIGQGRAEHWFTVTGRSVAAFAGLWDQWNGEPTFAFLTCAPNSLVKPLHPKAMPVILDESDYDRWMTADWENAKALVDPFPAQLMAVE